MNIIEEIKEEVTELLEAVVSEDHQVILYNDNINTFDDVIELLVKYCKHESLQAEQCAILVHYKGRCVVKKGSLTRMKNIGKALSSGGLTVEVE